MEAFQYRDNQLYCEGVSVAELAEKHGTPLYVYSQAALVGSLKALQDAYAEVDPLICYSVKANSNLGVLKVLGAHGSGFDRVAAFQDGYENGADKCAEYADPDVDRRTAEIGFTDTDYETGGNFPLYDEEAPEGEGLFTLVERDLNEFYGWYFDQLGASWTPVGDLVVVDPATDRVPCGGEQLSGPDLEYIAVYCEDENVVVIDGDRVVDC